MDSPPTPDESAAAKAVRLLGGPVRAAERLGVERYQTVQSWLRNRVPAEYCPLIERELGQEPRGEDRVRCEDLRPDVAWDVLRMQAGVEWDGTERRSAPRAPTKAGS